MTVPLSPTARWRDITREKLIELIIGREIKDEFAKFNEPTDETIMEVRELVPR